jgi:hypothetical protein
VVVPRRISDFKPLITNLAQTSHYQVIFGGLPIGLRNYLGFRGIDARFIGESVGLLCNSTSLPGSTFATADVIGNYMGVAEKMAHTRIFNQIEFEFYVDSSYTTLKFLEHWMEFISNGSGVSPIRDGYYFRMNYPENYKTNATRLVKFDRDYNRFFEYTFYGMFPISLSSIPISYGGSDILKASASFNFDRYVAGSTFTFDTYRNLDNNKIGNLATNFLNDYVNPNANKPGQQKRVPVPPGVAGSGVAFRPSEITTTEAVVNNQLYTNLIGERRI